MRFSVLITTKDYGKFLPQAIDSVLRQTLPSRDWELIVVDDGSVDDTAAIVRGYGDAVRYIFQENAGQAAALNRGLREAQGEFIALLDADDWFYETKLQELAAKFESDVHVGMVHHRMDVVDGAGKLLYTAPFRARLDEGDLREQLLRYGGTWNALTSAATSAEAFRRSALEEILPIPNEFRTMADGYLATQMALVAPVGAIRHSLAVYRLHGANNWATGALTADLIRRRYLAPMHRISELVAARVPVPEMVDVKLDRVYVEYLCLAEKLEGRSFQAMQRCGTLARALWHDARLGAGDKLWRWLHALVLLALPAGWYAGLKNWYTGNATAYRWRQRWLAAQPAGLPTLNHGA